MSSLEIISDYSKANLTEIPEPVLEMVNLKMLFLERNSLLKLPEDFFYRLPNLMWLDLRNNQLQELPTSIAHHEHLEHLLLTNNNIKKLPNELGLVTNLKALQVADNPLVYPPKKIIQQGTKIIKNFLKEQYEIECAKKVETERQAMQLQEELKNELLESRQYLALQEERLIKVHERASESASLERSQKASKDNFYSAHKFTSASHRNSRIIDSRTMEYLQNQLCDPNGLFPALKVKKMGHTSKPTEEAMKIVHNVSKSDSKIALKSYFQRPLNAKSHLERIPENVLKEGWLNKLRILLNDQERILQQERNLRVLSAWRQKKPSTPKIFYESDAASRTSEAPYATYPEYAKIPSRNELTSQLQSFLTAASVINERPKQSTPINLDKVINDLMEQLKEMETHYNDARTPRSEMAYAGKQIQTIVDIHKKLLQLKTANDYLQY